jgi:hypothetical protein
MALGEQRAWLRSNSSAIRAALKWASASGGNSGIWQSRCTWRL